MTVNPDLKGTPLFDF